MSRTCPRQLRRGFTLLEILVAMVILAILLGVALPVFWRSTERARSAEAVTNLSAIRQAQLLHQAQYGTFEEAIDLPSINVKLELELSARYFDYEIANADQRKFLIIATSRTAAGSSPPLRVTMDETGRLTYHWPDATGGSDGGSGGGRSGGRGGTTGGGSSSGGGGTSGGGSGSGGGDGGSTGGSGGDSSGEGDEGAGGSGTTPDLPAFMQETFGILANDGTLARQLAEFVTENAIQLIFEDLPFAEDCSGGVGGTIGPDSSWWLPQPGTSQVRLNEQLVIRCGWTQMEVATVLAHEIEHIRQVFAGLFLDLSNPELLWLEDVEGPAYITETLVWDSLRRDASGTITLTTDKNDVDDRANMFILPDGSVDVAAHNAFISNSRGIIPDCPFFFMETCDSST